MATENYKNIQHVVELKTDGLGHCKHCPTSFHHGLDDAINHYLEQHDYKILHIGTDTIGGEDGKPWYFTVALLGI